MKNDHLEKMGHLTNAVYQKHRQVLRELVVEESRLRQLILGLDAQDREARSAISDDVAIRALGKDLNWRRWSEKQRRELNTNLAMVLAKKERAFAKLQQSFGRNAAMDELHQGAVLQRRSDKHKREADTLQDLAMLRRIEMF